MRLLIISPHYNTFVKGAVEALATRVDSVDVLVHHNRLTGLAKLLPFGGYVDYARRFTKERLLNLEGKPGNVRVHFVSKFYFPPSSKNLRVGDIFTREMLKIVRKEGIEADLIHAHFTWPPGYIGARLKGELGIPLVITGHGYDVYDLPFRGEPWMERVRWALSRADAVTTVSGPNRRVLVEKLGVEEEKVHLIPNGVSKIFRPMDREEARRRLGIPVDGAVIVSVGSLIEVKGHEHLIRALKILKDSGLRLEAYIVGEGHLKGRLRDMIASLGLDGVTLVGPRPHGEIPLWMNAADLFVLPSLWEGLPTVMLEALACGTPFVGTKVGGVPDVINEEVGILVEPGSAEELAEAIRRALERKWDRDSIARYGSQFYWDRIAERYVDLYERILG